MRGFNLVMHSGFESEWNTSSSVTCTKIDPLIGCKTTTQLVTLRTVLIREPKTKCKYLNNWLLSLTGAEDNVNFIAE